MAEHDPVLVEKAAEPIARADGYMTDGEARSCARAVLDAVAPAIREAALNEAADKLGHLFQADSAGATAAIRVVRDMAAQQREEQVDGR